MELNFIKFTELRVTFVNFRPLCEALDKALPGALQHEALHEVLRSKALRSKTTQ